VDEPDAHAGRHPVHDEEHASRDHYEEHASREGDDVRLSEGEAGDVTPRADGQGSGPPMPAGGKAAHHIPLKLAPRADELGIHDHDPPSPVDDEDAAEIAKLPPSSEGTPGSHLIYRDPAGRRVKVDLLGQRYPADKFGLGFKKGRRRPETLCPDEYDLMCRIRCILRGLRGQAQGESTRAGG
jgi:hypothetical protein